MREFQGNARGTVQTSGYRTVEQVDFLIVSISIDSFGAAGAAASMMTRVWIAP